MSKRTPLLKEIGKATPLLSFTQDCHDCSGKMCPCQVALTWAHTKRCILSPITPPHGDAFAGCSQGSVSSICVSESFNCLHPYIWEFVDISSISVLISWDFLAWPYHTFFNILGTNSISWGKICERQKTKRRRLKNSVLLKYGNSWNIMVNSLKRNHNGLAGFLNRTNPSYYTGFDRSNKSSHINSAETGSPFGQW